MRDLFDIDEAPPAPAPAPVVEAVTPCSRRFIGPYRCRVGGGDACFSDDDRRTWFCRGHSPPGFLPCDR